MLCILTMSRVLPLDFNCLPQISKHFARMLLTHLLKVHFCHRGGQFLLVRSGTWHLRTLTALLIPQNISAVSKSHESQLSAVDSICGTQISTEKEIEPS